MDTPAAPDRFRRIATAVEHLIQEGEELLITNTEEGIVVQDKAAAGALETEHPRLYGRLLSLDAQMAGGMLPVAIGGVLIALFWLGLEAAWFDAWISGQVAEKVNVWWVYVLLVLLVFMVSGYLGQVRAQRVYRRGRAELQSLLQDAGLDRDLLLVQIRDDEELSNIAEQLKLDSGSTP